MMVFLIQLFFMKLLQRHFMMVFLILLFTVKPFMRLLLIIASSLVVVKEPYPSPHPKEEISQRLNSAASVIKEAINHLR